MNNIIKIDEVTYPYAVQVISEDGAIQHVSYGEKWKFESVDDIRDFQEKHQEVIHACRSIIKQQAPLDPIKLGEMNAFIEKSQTHIKNAEAIKKYVGPQRFAQNHGNFPKYKCQFPWPADTFLQSCESLDLDGSTGITNHEDAYIEVFLQSPDTFLRADAETIEEAEAIAWRRYQKILNCKEHEFIPRGLTNGAGFCKHCELFMVDVLEPQTTCCICNKPTAHAYDIEGKAYCENHKNDIPEGMLNSEIKYLESIKAHRAKQIEKNLLTDYWNSALYRVDQLLRKI